MVSFIHEIVPISVGVGSSLYQSHMYSSYWLNRLIHMYKIEFHRLLPALLGRMAVAMSLIVLIFTNNPLFRPSVTQEATTISADPTSGLHTIFETQLDLGQPRSGPSALSVSHHRTVPEVLHPSGSDLNHIGLERARNIYSEMNKNSGRNWRDRPGSCSSPVYDASLVP